MAKIVKGKQKGLLDKKIKIYKRTRAWWVEGIKIYAGEIQALSEKIDKQLVMKVGNMEECITEMRKNLDELENLIKKEKK